MNARVRAFTVYVNELIVGGQFTTAGGAASNYIASWDGTNWSTMGTGLNNFVHALHVYNNRLIVGGAFTVAGGKQAKNLAYWIKLGEDCCVGNRGDVNYDGVDANILDLTVMVDRIFRGGASPVCAGESDINSDGAPANILDLTFLVDRVFRGGPAPGPCN